MRAIFLLWVLSTATLATAQYNSKGKFHVAIGGALGGHGTAVEQRFTLFGLQWSQVKNGSAATTSLPVEIGFGLGQRFSLGLILEPGRYVNDSAKAQVRNNALAVVALQPRFYLVNKDRFAWSASLQLGSAALRILDETPGAKTDERYSGPAWGMGSGVAFGLGDKVGLEFHLRYLATRMELRAREFNSLSTMEVYNATLSTSGVVAQLSLAFRFGGK
ncbi:MAG: hypothetical protein KF905_06960 [Flavobacteriales bacterium]|nr:hypothetical protein [Flavobacteriales bacterium]